MINGNHEELTRDALAVMERTPIRACVKSWCRWCAICTPSCVTSA